MHAATIDPDMSKAKIMLMPPREGVCPMCAVQHDPKYAHNLNTIYYQMRFFLSHGRAPTWADAVAHCPPSMRAQWETLIREKGAWSDPPKGVEPIAEPVGSAVGVILDVTDKVQTHVHALPGCGSARDRRDG